MSDRENIEKILHDYCTNAAERAAVISPRYSELWREIDRYVLAGGKRMRPQLVLLAHQAYGGSANGIIHIAAAWELLHACLLVHDDIIDRDMVRHGQPNIAGKYLEKYQALTKNDPSHYALSAALLGGDLLLMGAYELMARADLNSNQKLLAQNYLTRALFAVAGGELIDTDAVLYPTADSNPKAVAEYKTASYSLQLPLECGAALAGAPEEEIIKLHAIGLHAGIAYQLRDDLLGIFGDSKTTGKSNRSDIFEKKRTFLIQQTMEKLNTEQAARLAELFSPNHTVTPHEAEEVVTLIVNSGAKNSTEQAIDDEIQKALDYAHSLHINDEYKSKFLELMARLTARTS